MSSPAPPDETGRVDALRALRVLDTAPEQAFDDVARMASVVCSAPIASVSLVDADREWGKATVGLPAGDVPRETSFAAQAILAPGGLLEVRDAQADARWAHNPRVTGPPWLRSYAGAAIVTSEGHAVGSVCVADHHARRLPAAGRDGLRILARQAAALLELRRQAGWLTQANAELRRQALEDPLTGLLNRATLHDRLDQALRMRARTHRAVGLVACGLEARQAAGPGRPATDELRRIVAARLARVPRASDSVARYADGTFLVLCPGLAAAQDARIVSERVRAAAERPVTLDGTSFVPRLTVVAVVAGAAEDGDAVLRRMEAVLDAGRPSAYA